MAALHAHRHRAAATAARVLLLAAVGAAVAASVGCRSAPGAARRPGEITARCTRDQPGILRVANYTGRLVEIYALRPVDHWRVFVAEVSTGTTEVEVPGPSDLGVRYDAVEPARGELLGVVTWIRSTSRGGASKSLLLELTCEQDSA